jgi:hypothetical protein
MLKIGNKKIIQMPEILLLHEDSIYNPSLCFKRDWDWLQFHIRIVACPIAIVRGSQWNLLV